MNLMRKAAIAVLALSATAAFAGPNVYYGAGFGFSQNNSAINSTQTVTDSGNATGVAARIVTGGEALQGLGFVGVSGSLSDMIRGSIQADLGFDGLSKDVLSESVDTTGSITAKIQSGLYYGASARLSVIRGDFAPYLMAGVRAGQWSADINNSSTGPIHGIAAGTSTSTSKTLVAPELGVGVNFTYSDQMDGRMEYKYMFGGTGTNALVDGSNTNTNGLSVRQQSVQFSLVF